MRNSHCRRCRRRGGFPISLKNSKKKNKSPNKGIASIFVHIIVYCLWHILAQPWIVYFFSLFVHISLRDSLAAQLEITLTKADSEQLARSIAEEQYSDLEKEKIMKELELKEMMARHRQEVAEKDVTISSVCNALQILQIIFGLSEVGMQIID